LSLWLWGWGGQLPFIGLDVEGVDDGGLQEGIDVALAGCVVHDSLHDSLPASGDSQFLMGGVKIALLEADSGGFAVVFSEAHSPFKFLGGGLGLFHGGHWVVWNQFKVMGVGWSISLDARCISASKPYGGNPLRLGHNPQRIGSKSGPSHRICFGLG